MTFDEITAVLRAATRLGADITMYSVKSTMTDFEAHFITVGGESIAISEDQLWKLASDRKIIYRLSGDILRRKLPKLAT